jgi:hypothetical protein
MKNVQWLSYLVLFGFFAVLTPRSFWHDCEDHKTIESHNSDETIAQDDCFVCEYDLGIIQQPTFLVFRFSKITYPIANDLPVKNYFRLSFEYFSRRGPPMA